MPDLATSVRRFYRRLVGGNSGPKADPGTATAADGSSTVAAVESWIGSVVPDGREGRSRLATALGLAAAGRRAAVSLSGAELVRSLDLVSEASRRRLPLVVHVTGEKVHEACPAAAATGAVLFFAGDVQDAADLTIFARRLAEDALVPALVAMDGPETAFSVQDVRLPSPETVARFVGRAGELVHPPTPSQEILFGKHRRRLPRWHDSERPLLHGAAFGSEASDLAAVARGTFFESHLSELLGKNAEAFEREIGRRIEALRTRHVEGAQFVLVAQGAAIEPAEAVAAALRGRKVLVGTVGLRILRPFPAAGLVEALGGRRGVAVLERTSSGGEVPLAAEIRSLLARAQEGLRLGGSSLPVLRGKDVPLLASVSYGSGDAALRAADLAALVSRMARRDAEWPSPIHLGLDSSSESEYPKRKAIDDALRRAYPELRQSGLRGDEAPSGVLPGDALVVSVHRPAGREGFSREAAALVHRLLGGSLRTRPALDGKGWGAQYVDVLVRAGSSFPNPGGRLPAHVAVCTAPGGEFEAGDVADGAAVLVCRGKAPSGFPRRGTDEELWKAVRERGLRVFSIDGEGEELLLGALMGVLRLTELADVSLRKLLHARRQILEGHGDEDVEARLDELQAGFERVKQEVPPTSMETSEEAPAAPAEPPAAVRRMGRSETPLSDLPGFWGRTGVLYRDGKESRLAPDPFLAAGILPPISSAFRGPTPARAMLPAFDPEPCTGCGACWSACPDSAVVPGVHAPSVLLDDGMRRATAQGHSVDKLRMVSSKLAAQVEKETTKGGWKGGDSGPLFEAAFDAVVGKMKLPEDRKEGLREAWKPVLAELSGLPVARTELFPGLFSLALDPDACKGCGLCVAVCEPAALASADDDPGRSAEARKLLRFCEELPPPEDAALEAARKHPDAGPLAGALLAREAHDVMSGGHGAEPGSGAALALRQVLGSAVYHLAPTRKNQLEEIGDLKDRLAREIHGGLAKALPGRDLDSLARGLDALNRPDADLADLTARVETAFEDERVDVARTRRLVDAARALADLEWRLEKGEGGLGSAPLGLVLAGEDLAWAATFPYHPFRVPVTLDTTGNAAELALGLLEGHVAAAVDAAKVLRRARLELDRPQEAARASGELAELAWEDLDDEERGGCPPVFLVTAEETWRRHTLAALDKLFDSNRPIKVVILTDSAAEDTPSSTHNHLLPTRAKILFVQSSVAHFSHLEKGVADALAHEGAAVLRVLAPSPAASGLASDATLEHARELVAEGRFPLLASDSIPSAGAGLPSVGQAPPADGPAMPASESAGGACPTKTPEIEELERRHGAEIAALRGEYEARLASERARYQIETAQRVRARLMRMATGTKGAEEARP